MFLYINLRFLANLLQKFTSYIALSTNLEWMYYILFVYIMHFSNFPILGYLGCFQLLTMTVMLQRTLLCINMFPPLGLFRVMKCLSRFFILCFTKELYSFHFFFLVVQFSKELFLTYSFFF